MQIRKAVRKRAKLRLGLVGPSGSGKTRSSLELAFGLGGKIGLIDTEHGSGDLYAHLGDYDIIQIGAPYTVNKYREAIKAFEDGGYSVIIIDSLSHAWAGEGGLLDKQGKIADSGVGNSYTAWRKITPEHNGLVEAILQSPAHMIVTMRAKQDYVQEKDEKTGKTTVKKIGLAPVQRDGMEYEMTVVMDIDANHVAIASKDRTGLLDGRYFVISKDTGRELLDWLESGEEPAPSAAELAIHMLNTAASGQEFKALWETNFEGWKAVLSDFDYRRVLEAKQAGVAKWTPKPEPVKEPVEA